ncbi:hypothetical protein ACFXTO_037439 [Malus domestica]
MEKYTAGNYGKAYLANNAALDIVGRGDVRVKLPSGARRVLHNVVMKGPLVLSYGFEEVPDFVCFVSKEKIDPSQTYLRTKSGFDRHCPEKGGENLDVAWGIGYLWFIDRLDLAAS